MLSFGPGQTLPLPDDLTGLGITFNSPNYSGGYFDHFHPDVYDITKYNFIRRTYGTEYTEVESTYTFLEVRAGDDINIGPVNGSDSYTGYENKTYNTTSIGGTPYGHAVTGNVPPRHRYQLRYQYRCGLGQREPAGWHSTDIPDNQRIHSGG